MASRASPVTSPPANSTTVSDNPAAVLYSFRRCPYAMRARMAIRYSGVQVELREVVLKNKPQAMLQASPKATVPVLVLADGQVIDESLDIMYWALAHNDPQQWRQTQLEAATESLIKENDNIFKIHLDHYKYFERFPEHPQMAYRQKGEVFLQKLDELLQQQSFLLSDHASLADIAIFPFIRQFAHVDLDWFRQSSYVALQNWLDYWLSSDTFNSVMKKYNAWDEASNGVMF